MRLPAHSDLPGDSLKGPDFRRLAPQRISLLLVLAMVIGVYRIETENRVEEPR